MQTLKLADEGVDFVFAWSVTATSERESAKTS